MTQSLFHLLAWVGVLATSISGARALGESPDFVREIWPIFQRSCVECHNSVKHKAGLRLDNRGDALAGGNNGPVIIAGHGDQSVLMHRLTGSSDGTQMPFKKPALAVGEIALIKAWIDGGAEWPASADGVVAATQEHWAFVKPVRPVPPVPSEQGHGKWVRNPIDNFIVARLEKEKLKPSVEASREALIRRLSLDLIGLPPTIAETDAFVNDASADAYEKVVDRLLASPHFGEKWARRWLDLARYADSNGYEKDRVRSMWPYRDWVINALNADMPFDQFTIAQLAGDLLPEATVADKVASGFNRNTMLNEEGGVDPEEYRYYACVDRVNTTATVFMAATLGCAQCHNHKFDPYTQKDYYQFLAYFNSGAAETEKPAGGDPHDVSPKLTVETAEEKELNAQLAALRVKLDEQTPEIAAAEARWESEVSTESSWVPLKAVAMTSSGGAAMSAQSDGSILVSGDNSAIDTYVIDASCELQQVAALRLEALSDGSLPSNGPGRAGNGNFALTHLSLAAGAGDPSKWPMVKLRDAAADFSQDGWPVGSVIEGAGNSATGWAVVPRTGQAHTAIFQLSDGLTLSEGQKLRITLEHKSTNGQHNLGHFRISVSATHDTRGALPGEIATILAKAAAVRTEADRVALSVYFRSIDPGLKSLREQIAAMQKRVEEIRRDSTTLVMEEVSKPRESYIHIRGGFMNLGAVVEPGTPALFRRGSRTVSESSAKRIQNRLDLARWIVGPDNPLTARVTVNRIWEEYFGRGIVGTSEDFGTQGDLPTHPELLDWLATELVARHWSMKAIHRLIVTSAAYRQSSNVTADALERDPDDRLLSRAPRYRMPAEQLRDGALAASGLLSSKMGGPAVFPLQPNGVWNVVYSGDQWNTSGGEDRYRRGIYTMLRRSAPYPAFVAFDMTSRESICPRRSRTNTPLQALTMLNDPATLEAALALAVRILKDGGADVGSRVRFGFRSVLVRSPDAGETQRLSELFARMMSDYSSDPKAARALLQALPVSTAAGNSDAELASWTMVCNVLLNLDETLSRQ